MLAFLVRCALRLCALCALSASLLCVALPASAARHQADITCEQMSQMPADAAGMLMLWLPGWWSARHNDPGVNAYRISLLAQHLGDVCPVNPRAYILATTRKFNNMPKVPDNGLTYKCADFLTAGAQWQVLLTMWLQGYVAGETGDTFVDDGAQALISSYEAQCRRNPKLTMGEVARAVGKRAR